MKQTDTRSGDRHLPEGIDESSLEALASQMEQLGIGKAVVRAKGMQAFALKLKKDAVLKHIQDLSSLDTLSTNVSVELELENGEKTKVDVEGIRQLQRDALVSVGEAQKQLVLSPEDPLFSSFEGIRFRLALFEKKLEADSLYDAGDDLGLVAKQLVETIADALHNPNPARVTIGWAINETSGLMQEKVVAWADLDDGLRTALEGRKDTLMAGAFRALSTCNDFLKTYNQLRRTMAEKQAAELKTLQEELTAIATLAADMDGRRDHSDDILNIKTARNVKREIAASVASLARIAADIRDGTDAGLHNHSFIDPKDLEKRVGSIFRQAGEESETDFIQTTPQALIGAFARLLQHLDNYQHAATVQSGKTALDIDAVHSAIETVFVDPLQEDALNNATFTIDTEQVRDALSAVVPEVLPQKTPSNLLEE